MPVTLKGATSGDVTINAPAVAGTTSITLPAVSGGEFIVSNSSGNVGIGTNSPLAKLETLVATGNSAARFKSGSSTLDYAEFGGTSYLWNNGSTFYTGTNTNHAYVLGTNNLARFQVGSDGQLSAVVAGGSALYPAYTARAWVNFNGTGTVAIRASGNVTSITDGGTGTYTVNLTTAMPDANFAASIMSDRINAGNPIGNVITAQTASSLSMVHIEGGSGTLWDTAQMQVAIFR